LRLKNGNSEILVTVKPTDLGCQIFILILAKNNKNRSRPCFEAAQNAGTI